MTLTYEVDDPDLGWTDISSRIFRNDLDVTANAEEGSVAISTVVIDDPDGDFDIVGHRAFRITESAAGGDTVFYGFTAEQEISRGPLTDDNIHYSTGASRIWKVQLTDMNTLLSRRVMVGADCNRPAETDVERVTWLMSTVEATSIEDSTTYFPSTNAVDMDAVNYRGQMFVDVLDDCAKQSGKNYYVTNLENTATLWYDLASSSNYSSSIALSNVESDIDDVTTFAIYTEETKLRRDPKRIVSGGYLPYDKGYDYQQVPATAAAFANRDGIMPHENVKTKAKARARNALHLSYLNTQEEIVTTRFLVPAASVNGLREGMRIPFRASHLPGYEDTVTVRCLNRNVVQRVDGDYFEILADLTGPVASLSAATSCPDPTPSGTYYALGGSGNTPNASDGPVYYWRPGVSAPSVPTAGHIGKWHFPTYSAGGIGTTDYAGTCVQNRARGLVVGDGVMTFHTAAGTEGDVALTAALQHFQYGASDGSGVTVTDQVFTGWIAGQDKSIAISTHGGTNCVHWIDLKDAGDACGQGWGFVSVEWELAA